MEFIILPDMPFRDTEIARFSQAVGEMTITHSSGRPWIVGRWTSRDVMAVTVGTTRLVIFGRTRVDLTDVERELADLNSPHKLDGIAHRIPGAVHLLLSSDGVMRSQGCVSTVRQIFHATIAGITVAASSVGPLRRLMGSAIDREALALRLLSPIGAPWPLSTRTFWTGIEPVASGYWLEMDRHGSSQTHRWWHPPASSLPLAEAAEAVRDALMAAVAARIPQRGVVSADLSGGLDSTSISFAAAAKGADLVTFHVKPLDAGNTDTVWAARAAAAMPDARHRMVPSDRPANLFQVDIEQGTDAGQWEGPQLWIGGWAHLADLAERVAAEGSDFHMMGFGGDTLFGTMPALLWSLFHRHPVRSLPIIRRSRLLNRWSWRACVRGLGDRSTFAAALAALSEQIEQQPPRPPYLDLGWMPAVRIPPWVTPDTMQTVRRCLLSAAVENPQPLDADRTRHQILEAMLFEGALVRQIRAATDAPVEWDAPMLDHQVVEAAMSVGIAGRTTPGRYKPVLSTAMRGVVPDDILDRPDKGEFSAEMHMGLRRNRQLLLALCDDSRLAGLGLIDARVLRGRLLDSGPVAHHLTILQNTLACESWLRSAAVTSSMPARTTGATR